MDEMIQGRQYLIDLIGSYEPIMVTDKIALDVPFIICGLLTVVTIYCIFRGLFSLCKR